MKILQFIETGGPGGAEQVVLQLSKDLLRKDIKVLTATFREGWLTTNLDKEGIPRILLNTGTNKFVLIKNILKLLKDEEIDLVHSHLLDSNFYLAIACCLKKIPHIATEHGDIHHLNKKKFGYFKTKTISHLSSKIIAVSDFTKKALVKSGMKSGKIVVIPNPYPFQNTPTPHQSDKTNLMTTLKLPFKNPPQWIWIHVANLRKVKDQHTLLEGYAMAQSRHKIPQKLLIAGDGEFRDELEQKALSLNIDTEVHFLGFRNDIKELLSISNGLLLSSISEAMPISLLEAAEKKLLIVCTRVGGIPELITHGESGLLYPPKDPQSLASQIDFAISNQELAHTMALKGHHEIKKRCNSDTIIKTLIDLYSSLKKKPSKV